LVPVTFLDKLKGQSETTEVKPVRTLLTDILPPQPGEPKKRARTFSQPAVLASVDHLTEVGVVGTVIAAPSGEPVERTGATLERGVAFSPQPDPGL